MAAFEIRQYGGGEVVVGPLACTDLAGLMFQAGLCDQIVGVEKILRTTFADRSGIRRRLQPLSKPSGGRCLSEFDTMWATKIEFFEASFSVSVCRSSNSDRVPPMGRRSNMTEASICASGAGVAIQPWK